MSMWPAILLVALGSYGLRVTPMLLRERMKVSQRADARLRHASMGAMTAMLVLGVMRVEGGPIGPQTLATCLGVAVSGAAALRGRPMLVALLAGAAAYALGLLGLSTFWA